MKYFITTHAKNRYVERILTDSKLNHYSEILKELSQSKNITSQLANDNPRFILYVKERYGCDKGYHFLKNNDNMFILTKRKNTNDLYDVLTCYKDEGKTDGFMNTKLNKEQIHLKLAILKSK